MSAIVKGARATAVPLDPQDRCDRCPAQAKMRAILRGGDLLFCRHHGQKFLPDLVEVALDVHVDLDN